MSWNGTVRCSWCYASGHNRAGCPELKKYIAENPDSFEASREKRKQESRTESVKGRRCSYCGGDERGGKLTHNRRGCKLRKSDITEFQRRNAEWRVKALDTIKRAGLAPGALVEVPYHRCGTSAHPEINARELYLVEEIDWNKLTHRLAGNEEDHSDEKLRFVSSGRDVIRARLISWEGFPENFEDRDYWHSQNLKPMHRVSLDIIKFALGSTFAGVNEDGEISDGYYYSRPERVRNRIVSPVKPASVEKSVPESFYEAELSSQVRWDLNFDKEGHRRVGYEGKYAEQP